ncbi:MAG: DinB family protein [Bacteroidota bacterium]
MQRKDLAPTEYDEYTAYYLGLVLEGRLLELLEASRLETVTFFEGISPDYHNYRYAPGKWTIKDVVQHLIDVERIFAYRALRFARGEALALSGFDVDAYGAAQRAARRSMEDLLAEYSAARQSTIHLFQSFDEKMLLASGVASGFRLSVRAIGFKLVGHDLHHVGVVKERYIHINNMDSIYP